MFQQLQKTHKICVCFYDEQVYEEAYHALHHDLPDTVESVLKEVSTWILERLPTPHGS